MKPYEEQTLPERLRNRAAIRRKAKGRKSVEEGKPDRLSDQLDEAADRIEALEKALAFYANPWTYVAIAFLPDPPCGEFIQDFGPHDCEEDPLFETNRAGVRARKALGWTQEQIEEACES